MAARTLPRTARAGAATEFDAGEAELAAVRADPGRLPELRAGAWFERRPAARAAIRLVLGLRLPRPLLPATGGLAFWAGVRSRADAAEWRRITRSSYVALYYHRLAGEFKPGQDRLDLDPGIFDRQLAALGRLGFRALTPGEQIAHHHAGVALPARGYVVTVDDGFEDGLAPLRAQAARRPQWFVPTREVGGRAWWAGDEALAGWAELASVAAAGVVVASHGERHVALTDLAADDLDASLLRARQELEARIAGAEPLLAYPHGRHDARVRAAAAAAGYRLAYTTEPGRNGAGTPPFALRRVGVKAWDTRGAVVFKVLTGAPLPRPWERWCVARWRVGRALRRRR